VDEVAVEEDEEGRRGVAGDPVREVAGRMKASLRELRGEQEGMGWCSMMHLDVIVNAVGTETGTDEQIVEGIGMRGEQAGIGMRGMRGGDLGRGARTIGIEITAGTNGIGIGTGTGTGIGGEVEVNGNEIIEIIEIGDRLAFEERDSLQNRKQLVMTTYRGVIALGT